MLAQDLGPDARVLDLVGRDAGPLVGRDVAHAVAAGLHAVQAGAREVGHGVRQLCELDPVELDVLPRGEMAVVAVVAARDVGEHAHLLRRQGAVRNGDAQHVGVELQIDAVHQAQRLELVFGQLARQAARHLVAEFGDALGDQRAVEVVVEIHGCPQIPRLAGRSKVGPAMPDAFAQVAGPHRARPFEPHRRHVGVDGAEVVGHGRRQQLGGGRRRAHDGGLVELRRPAGRRACGRSRRHRQAGWR